MTPPDKRQSPEFRAVQSAKLRRRWCESGDELASRIRAGMARKYHNPRPIYLDRDHTPSSIDAALDEIS